MSDNKNDYWFNLIIETIINVMFFVTPYIFDHFFNTNCNSNYENFIHMLPNILSAFLIIK